VIVTDEDAIGKQHDGSRVIISRSKPGNRQRQRRKIMLNTFEAIYEDGRLKWLSERPDAGQHHVLVTILDRNVRSQKSSDVNSVLEATRGAWGCGKSLDALDAELDQVRAEWGRPF